jgi:hypothetical protein
VHISAAIAKNCVMGMCAKPYVPEAARTPGDSQLPSYFTTLEIARMLVRLDHVASFIVNANHGVV